MLHLLKRSANDQGYFDIRNKDLATMLKVQDGQTSQIASALKKAGLLKVEEIKPVNAVFRFVKTESTPETGKRFGEYMKKLSQLPRREDGSTEANMEEIARLIGNEKDTVKKNLKTWAEAGFVEFTPPAPAFNRYTVKVDPDSAEVAEKLKAMTAQKKRAFSSLDAVTMISQVEGSGRKHAIIEQYYESSIRDALAKSEGGYSSGGLEDSAGSADE
jgi:DNA-binding MarR family transcriptional regulator